MAELETAEFKEPGDDDDDQLPMIDHGEGEQDSQPNNKPEDLLELTMTADELQNPEDPEESSNISPQNGTRLSVPTDKLPECKHNCCTNYVDRIAIKGIIQGNRQLASCG